MGEAAAKLGVPGVILRRWGKSQLASAFRTFGGHQRFSARAVLNAISDKQCLNIFTPACRHMIKEKNVDTQADFLGRHCDNNHIQYE